MMGVLRLLDGQGKAVDATFYLGGAVRFGRAKRSFTATAIRLDLPTGERFTQRLGVDPALGPVMAQSPAR